MSPEPEDLSERIPDDIDWVLRVDGHTDSRPIDTILYPSNWELSAARAISVVELLIDSGIPPDRLVAAGFGQFHPLDDKSTPEAYCRNPAHRTETDPALGPVVSYVVTNWCSWNLNPPRNPSIK